MAEKKLRDDGKVVRVTHKDVSSRSRRLKVNSALGRAKRADLFRSDAFIDTAPTKDLKENPLAQLRAASRRWGWIFAKSGKRAIAEAYDHGYRLREIAAHLSVHYGTVSNRLKQIEANEVKQCGTARTDPGC